MSTARPAPGGLLELRLEHDSRGRTVVASRAQRFPLRMTVPMYLDGTDPDMAFIFVQNPTGAVFAGDELEVRIAAGEGTRAHITGQSATKIARMDGGSARQRLAFALAPHVYLEYLPDPIIPQAGAQLEQRLEVELAHDAAFVTAETVGPGRRPLGERFAYERLSFRTDVRRDGHSLCIDALELEPRRRRPDAPGILGRHAYAGTVLAAAPEHDVEALAEAMHAALTARPDVLGAASVLPNGAGAGARVLSDSAPAARRALVEVWRVARERLVGLPLPELRK